MADLDVTKKLSVYHLLYRINLSFTNIVRRCRELDAARLFRPRYLRRFQGFAQELQSEINSELLETLSETEERDWTRFGKIRDAWEKYLRDPDDVFIHADERRRQLARRGKKASTKQPAFSNRHSSQNQDLKANRRGLTRVRRS
jgi:hypothetical protein